jgi:hypothetical protein
MPYVGDMVAEANEGIQESTQAGMQGIRNTKVYESKGELSVPYKASPVSLS